MRYVPGVNTEATESADPASRAAYGLVLVAVPLVTSNALRAGSNLTYGDVPLALAAGLLMIVWLRHGHPRGVVPWGLPLGALILLATGLLAIVPAADSSSLLPTLRFAVTLGAMPLIIMLAASTPRRVQRVVDAWLLGAAVNSAAGALELLHLTTIGDSLTGIPFVAFTHRATGLTLHPNHLGLVCAMALPVAVARLGSPGRRGLVALGLVPLLLVGLAVSGSRGAIIAAAASVAIYFLLGVKTRRSRTALLLLAGPFVAFLGLAAVLGGNSLVGTVALDRLAGAGTTQSNGERLLTLRQSISEAGHHLLVGEGFSVVRTAHDIYVQLAQAGGLLALVGFLVFAVSVVRRARWLAQASHGSPPWLMGLAAGAGASVCAWLLFGVVGNAVYDRYLYVPVGLVLALALVQSRFFTLPESAALPSAARPTPAGSANGRPLAAPPQLRTGSLG